MNNKRAKGYILLIMNLLCNLREWIDLSWGENFSQ